MMPQKLKAFVCLEQGSNGGQPGAGNKIGKVRLQRRGSEEDEVDEDVEEIEPPTPASEDAPYEVCNPHSKHKDNHPYRK